MYICTYVCISLYMLYIYMYLFIYVKTDKKIFYMLLFWNECSTLEPLSPFIRHPFQNSPYGHDSCGTPVLISHHDLRDEPLLVLFFD